MKIITVFFKLGKDIYRMKSMYFWYESEEEHTRSLDRTSQKVKNYLPKIEEEDSNYLFDIDIGSKDYPQRRGKENFGHRQGRYEQYWILLMIDFTKDLFRKI